MKKYLIIGLIVLLGIGLFVLGYFLRKGGGEPEPVGGGDQNLPPISTSTPSVVVKENKKLKLESLGFGVEGFFVGANGEILIVQPSGHITSIKEGKNTLLSETNVNDIIQADFSADGKRVLLGFGGRNKPQFSVYDLEKKSWQPLVEGVVAAAWSQNDQRVAYALKKPNYTSLSVIDFGVAKPVGKEITRIHVEDVVLAWAGKDEVIFYNKGNSKIPSSAWKIHLTTKKLTQLFKEKTSFEVKVDGRGENILALADQGGSLTLSFYGAKGEFLKELAVKTLTDKCDFDLEKEIIKATSTKAKDQTIEHNSLYCAAPKNFSVITGKILTEDYVKKQTFSLDNFFRFDVPNGVFVAVYEGQESLDAAKVQIASGKVYFINRYDEKLYSIALK